MNTFNRINTLLQLNSIYILQKQKVKRQCTAFLTIKYLNLTVLTRTIRLQVPSTDVTPIIPNKNVLSRDIFYTTVSPRKLKGNIHDCCHVYCLSQEKEG